MVLVALLQLLAVVTNHLAMADSVNLNPDISIGNCYYYDGYEANSRYMPCGNVALGHKSCCESLDMCLSSHACYNAQYGVTYLAGCTDSTYKDVACPDKKVYQDQQWAGLVYCNGTSNQWVTCMEGDSDTVTTPLPCWCPDANSRTVAFSDSSVLRNIMSLPATYGQTVTWKDADAYTTEHMIASALGYYSTTATSATSTSSASSSSSTTSSDSIISSPLPFGSASSTSTSETSGPISTFAAPVDPASTAGNSGLSSGAKAGIAVAAVAGAGALALLGWIIYTCMRRRSRRNEAKAEEPPPMREPTLPQIQRRPTDPELRSPAWSGHKSELPADESMRSASPFLAYQDFHYFRGRRVSEVEGSSVKTSPVRPAHDGGLRVPGQKGTFYEMAG